MDFSSAGMNTTANGGRGSIGIYNYGAESGAYRNFGISAAIPFVFTRSNVAGVKSAYQDLGTGCKVTMTGELIDTGTTSNYQAHQLSLPNIEADGTANMTVVNNTFVGGLCGIQFEGSMAVKWHVVANQEKSVGHFLCNSVDVDDSFFHVMSNGPVSFLNPTADNVSYINDQFFFSTRGASVPLIADSVKGSKIIAGYASYSGPTKASNTVVIGTMIVSPKEKKSAIESSFNAASQFFYVGSDGSGIVAPR
jgi:hypothetical protein